MRRTLSGWKVFNDSRKLIGKYKSKRIARKKEHIREFDTMKVTQECHS